MPSIMFDIRYCKISAILYYILMWNCSTYALVMLVATWGVMFLVCYLISTTVKHSKQNIFKSTMTPVVPYMTSHDHPITFYSKVLAKRLVLGRGYDKLAETDESRKKINKFKESAWKFIYFLSGELLSLSVTYNEPWFKNTRYFWVGPGEQIWPDQKIKLKLKAVYMYAAGFYTYSIFALLFWETRRSDFGVSMSHHVATVVLIVLSYIFRFARVGSVVLALHDASDIFLEIGKMSKYSSCEWLAVVAFLLFVLSWIVLRLIIFPFWILRSTSYEVLLTLDKEKHRFYGPIYYYVFNSLLFSLLVLHIYWWILIYRMLVKQIQSKGRVGDDVRSDSEGEDEHED